MQRLVFIITCCGETADLAQALPGGIWKRLTFRTICFQTQSPAATILQYLENFNRVASIVMITELVA
jgi:hypothetical protein